MLTHGQRVPEWLPEIIKTNKKANYCGFSNYADCEFVHVQDMSLLLQFRSRILQRSFGIRNQYMRYENSNFEGIMPCWRPLPDVHNVARKPQ